MFKASEQLIKEYSNKLFIESKSTCDKSKGCGIAKQCVDSIGKEFANMEKMERFQAEEREVDHGQAVIETRGHKAWTDVSAQEVTIADLPTFHADTTPRLRSGASSISKESLNSLDSLD